MAAWRGNKRVRGGGYWGVAGEEVRDIAAGLDLAEARGFRQIVLIGHSAGAAAVRRYQAEAQDARVVGLVLASGSITVDQPSAPDQVAEANRLMAAGESEALVRDPKRSFPSYISAAPLLDIANSALEYKDFFGLQPTTQNPAVVRIACPLLAFFGTRGDVGNEKDLARLKACLQRLPHGPSRVDSEIIPDADHMYAGQEVHVAETIARWADALQQK